MPDYAGVLAFRGDRVALVREHYEGWDDERWNLPSGAIEPGESPEEGAVRELREETGLVVPVSALTLVAEVLVQSLDGSVPSRLLLSFVVPASGFGRSPLIRRCRSGSGHTTYCEGRRSLTGCAGNFGAASSGHG